MKRLVPLIFAVAGLVAGCHDHHDDGEPGSHDHGGQHDAGHPGDDDGDHDAGGTHADHGHGHAVGALTFTRWTERTELFVEFPQLVVGEPSPFAAHLTRMSDFAPVDSGVVTVVLAGGGSAEERFVVDAPSVAGIFRPVATPAHAGRRWVTLLLGAPGLDDVHDLGEIDVFADVHAAAAAATDGEETPGRISFLKEQQWPIEFATMPVAERDVRPSLRLHGTLRARADGEAWVTAPIAGRLAGAGDVPPRIGMDVARGDALALIVPRLGPESDVATLDLAARRAALELEQATRERQRLERLFADGAVAERRVLEARNDQQQAEARRAAATRRLEQQRAVQRVGPGAPMEGTAVPAPIGGTVAAVTTTPGLFVEEGEPLVHIVDLDRLWLEVRVPEAHVGDLGEPGGVWFQVEGLDRVFEAGADRVVALGGVVDAATRTLPLLFEIDNPGRVLRIGMFVRAHVLTGPVRQTLAIPVEAVIHDAGVDTVYVQVEGESFERRVVRLGVRDRAHVEVLSGVTSGERVVTRGAYAVKLAAAGTQVPAHGHAH
jgi:RND family efflux transporter MFP subunit